VTCRPPEGNTSLIGFDARAVERGAGSGSWSYRDSAPQPEDARAMGTGQAQCACGAVPGHPFGFSQRGVLK
jgi:hypothetical protein